MPVQVFVDESGGKGQGAALVCAGLFGEASEWLPFSDEWRAVLDIPPRLPSFKMNRAVINHKRRPEEWDDRVRRLVSVINAHELKLIYCAIDLKGHAATIASALDKPFKDPYFWAFQTTILHTALELHFRGDTNQFEAIFDENAIFGPRARDWYPMARWLMPPPLKAIAPSDPLFRKDDEFMPLQAADLVVGYLRREMEGVNHPYRWIRQELSPGRWSRYSQTFTQIRFEEILRGAEEETAETWAERGRLFPPVARTL
jgi:hypothetical protein